MASISGGTRRADSDKNEILKISVLGECATGRTSLIHRFVTGESPRSTPAPGGFSISRKTLLLDDAKYQVHVHDGQVVKTEDLLPMYLRGTAGIILVYDPFSEDSFGAIKTWYDRLKGITLSTPAVVLVANKCDLDPSPQCFRRISYEQGKALATELGIDSFFEVSARTGDNVEQAFITLIAKIVKTI